MLKSDYEFQDKEVRDFYYRAAMKRPSERNRGGGMRITDKALIDVDEVNDTLDILFYYRLEFIEHRKFRYLSVLEKVREKIFSRAYEFNKENFGEITIPDSERGKVLAGSRLSRKLRALCDMLDSILNNKPNEMARYIFSR